MIAFVLEMNKCDMRLAGKNWTRNILLWSTKFKSRHYLLFLLSFVYFNLCYSNLLFRLGMHPKHGRKKFSQPKRKQFDKAILTKRKMKNLCWIYKSTLIGKKTGNDECATCQNIANINSWVKLKFHIIILVAN